MELSPRTGPAPGETAGPGLATPAPGRPGGRRVPVILVLVAIVGVAGFVIVNALGNATMFFYNADEAVARHADLGTSRFRIQGTVLDGTIVRTPDGVEFTITYNGVEVPVRHQGDPPELFEVDIPVVLEGRFAGEAPGPGEQAAGGATLFLSDRMLVKHTEEYKANEGDRLRQAEDGGHGDADGTAAGGGAGQADQP